MLADPSEPEREILGAIPYQRNEAVLHTDTSLLPRRRAAWSSWNFHLAERPPRAQHRHLLDEQPAAAARRARVSGHAQPRRGDRPGEGARAASSYDHPVYTAAGVAAQARHAEISGVRRTHYCGAYWGWGFHEDGVVSALRACARDPTPNRTPTADVSDGSAAT